MTRYSRQIPIFGEDGQRRIRETTVGVVGLGGLGCSVVTQLASAGVGRLVVADPQTSDETNMNRQFIHSAFPLGRRKADNVREWVRRISETNVTAYDTAVDDGNVDELLAGCSVVVDCTDSDASRFVLNRHALSAGVPLVHGGIEGMFGQVTTVIPGKTPCLGCILPGRVGTRPATGPAAMLIASVQAAEVLKLITGVGIPLAGRLFLADMSENMYRTVDILTREGCEACNDF